MNVWRAEKLSFSTSGVIQWKSDFVSSFSYENKECIKECSYQCATNKSLYSGYIIKKDNICQPGVRNVSFFMIRPLQ